MTSRYAALSHDELVTLVPELLLMGQMIDRSGMAVWQCGQTAGASDEAVAPSRRRESCITVGGVVGSSG